MELSVMREREAGVLLRLLHKSSSATLPQAGVPVTAAAAELSILPEEVQLLAALINEKAEPLIHSPVIELCGQPGKLRLRLSAPCDLLDADEINRLSSGRGRVEVLTFTPSTNTALEECLANAVSGDALLAELQTAGRGRRGGSWHTGLGHQLTMSLCWKFSSVDAAWGLPLVSALAAVKALSFLKLPIKIKWPNDLYLNGGKLCGILVELHPLKRPSGTICAAVIGMGLNVYTEERITELLPSRQISALGLQGQLPCTRSQLAAALISALRAELECFSRTGFTPYMQQWEQYDFLKDKDVVLELDDGQQVQGRNAGADERGRLLLKTADGLQAFAAGHILAYS